MQVGRYSEQDARASISIHVLHDSSHTRLQSNSFQTKKNKLTQAYRE